MERQMNLPLQHYLLDKGLCEMFTQVYILQDMISAPPGVVSRVNIAVNLSNGRRHILTLSLNK